MNNNEELLRARIRFLEEFYEETKEAPILQDIDEEYSKLFILLETKRKETKK